MYDVGFGSEIQGCPKKFIRLHKFNSLLGYYGFLHCIRPSSETVLRELDVRISKVKKKHFQDHLTYYISQKQHLMKIAGTISLICD